MQKDYLKINLVVAYLFVFGLCIPLMQLSTFIPISAINLSVTALYCLFMMANFLYVKAVYFLVVGTVGLWLSSAITALYILNLIPGGFISFRMYEFGAVWEAIFFSMALSVRDNQLHNERRSMLKVIKGYAPETDLNEIVTRPYGHQLKQRSDVVTIMFIDIVGFSITAQKLGSEATYSELSRWNQKIHSIINKFGGTIDRSLGDGILCFFGHGEVNDSVHAKQAFQAAIAIQQDAVDSISSYKHSALFPTRIGISTEEVIIGNLGGKGRVDYTMIGDGVNFTSRLENACNPFKIMLSRSSYQYIPPEVFDTANMNPIFIKIKHRESLVQAYEYNPFPKQFQKLIESETRFFEYINSHGVSQRTNAVTNSMQIVTPLTDFEVRDFSLEGFGVVSNKLFGPNTSFEVALHLDNPEAMILLEEHYLNTFSVEVRWSRASSEGFKHGLKIRGLSSTQQEILYDILNLQSKKDGFSGNVSA